MAQEIRVHLACVLRICSGQHLEILNKDKAYSYVKGGLNLSAFLIYESIKPLSEDKEC